MDIIPKLTDAGRALLIAALSGSPLNFTQVKIGNGSAPEEPQDGDYWYDTENQTLFRYTVSWFESERTIYTGTTEPISPSENDLWYNTNNRTLYYYGSGWKTSGATITCSSSAPAFPSSGDYWYDTANTTLYTYTNRWNAGSGVIITCSSSAPASPSSGDYWYDTANSLLEVCSPQWGEKSGVTLASSDTAPASPSDGDYWYDTENDTLKTYDETQEAWETSQQPFSYGAAASASPTVGDWWYDTANSTLKEYALAWVNDSTHTFNYGETPPSTPSAGDWWYDTSLHVYGVGWVADTQKNFTYGSNSPSPPQSGYWWFDSAHSILREYGLLFLEDTGDTFTYSSTAPVRAYNDDLWYNTSSSKLLVYLAAWSQSDQHFTYASSPPDTPAVGYWWYDTLSEQLNEYNGTRWAVNSTTITCSSSVPATQDALTDLINPLISMEINQFTRGTNHVELTCSFDNSNLASGFNWVETGIFAEDLNGNDVLYAYCHSGDQYEYIPANDVGKTIETSLTIPVMIGDATEVSAIIGEGAIYVTREAFEAHKRDFTNPHGVSKEQIGLGNVENVSPANMVIQYTIASALVEPKSGEDMRTFLGKVKKAINTLILHLSAGNPHSITPSKIGAAASSHSHAASEITSGTLPPERGGTGVTSISKLAEALGSYFKVPVFGYYSGNGTVKRLISLEFTPSAVLLVDGKGRMYSDGSGTCGGLAVGTHGVASLLSGTANESSWSNAYTALLIGTNGFWVNYNAENKIGTNSTGETYRYIAFR